MFAGLSDEYCSGYYIERLRETIAYSSWVGIAWVFGWWGRLKLFWRRCGIVVRQEKCRYLGSWSGGGKVDIRVIPDAKLETLLPIV